MRYFTLPQCGAVRYKVLVMAAKGRAYHRKDSLTIPLMQTAVHQNLYYENRGCEFSASVNGITFTPSLLSSCITAKMYIYTPTHTDTHTHTHTHCRPTNNKVTSDRFPYTLIYNAIILIHRLACSTWVDQTTHKTRKMCFSTC